MALIHFLMYSLFIAIFFGDATFLSNTGPVGRYLGLIPDLLSGVLLLVVIAQAVVEKKIYIHPKYVILGLLIVMHLFGGVLINSVQPGAIFAGIRAYFKWIPIFLLPMVYTFTERDIKNYFKFILALSLLQLPVALYQRFIQFSFSGTGDVVRGTLSDSGNLSLYLVSVIAVLTAFYVRKCIGIGVFSVLLLCLFIPTTINETKSTLILLPFALFIPILSGGVEYSPNRSRQLVGVSMVGIILFSIFVAIYNQHWAGEGSVTELFTEGKIVEKIYHEDKSYQEDETGKGYDTGRIDSIIIALRELSRDPVHLVAGLGMGNVGASFSSLLKGEYSEKYADWGVRVTNISYLLWEIGVIGVLMMVVFLYFLFRDARLLIPRNDFIGVMGLAWSTVVVIISVAMFYKTFVGQNTISYSFWFFSGYIVAEAIRERSNVMSIKLGER